MFSSDCRPPLVLRLAFFLANILLSSCATSQVINSVSMLTDPEQTTNYPHVLNITGAGFASIGAPGTVIPLVVVPNTCVSGPTAVILSATGIEGRFTAPIDYRLSSVVLTPAGVPPITFAVPAATCSPNDIVSQYQIAPDSLAKDTFGNGLAKNFYVIQLSIINKCQSKVVIPIAGIRITPQWQTGNAYVTGPITTSPYGLDHVMAAYNTDRTSTGSRALMLNFMQAAATIGSAVQTFLAPGFTQGVAIFGGSFRNAVLEVSKDLSPQQLKSLASETFQTAEVIGTTANPGVQKFIFVPKKSVKLPNNQKQRIVAITSITLTWSVADNSTQTSQVQ